MANIIKISDATALALHSMVHLTINPDRPATTTEVAKTFKVSKHHLAKVHQRLTKAGFIISYRGPGGGVVLAKDPAGINLLDIYEAMEGPISSTPCLFGKEVCPLNDCVLSGLLPKVAEQVRDYFARTTLAQLAKESSWGTVLS